MSSIKIGDKLFKPANKNTYPDGIKEFTVSKIGRKYFYLEENDRYKIEIETLKYINPDYSQSNFQLYKTKEEILEMNECLELDCKIKNIIRTCALTLDELRAIDKIIGKYQ